MIAGSKTRNVLWVILHTLVALLGWVFLFPDAAQAAGSAGIEVGLDSAKALGKGNAVVADPQDATTVVLNPAGLTRLEANQMVLGTSVIVATNEYHSVNGPAESGSVIPAFLPNFFLASNTPWDKLTMGLGVNSPFGAAPQYESLGQFKYNGINSEVKMIAYTLAAAYEATPWLSLGGGFSYADVDLRQIAKLNAAFISRNNGGAGTEPDVPTESDLEGKGMGWNAGFLLTPNDIWTIGLFYRSIVNAEMKGEYNADNLTGGVLPTIFGDSPSFRTSVDTDITFPDSLSLGANYRVNDDTDVEVDLTWTNWSMFDQFDWAYGKSNAVLDLNDPLKQEFQDTLSVNVGVSHRLNDIWTISGGYTFYEDASSVNKFENLFRDGDRHGIAAGVSYDRGNYTFAFAYSGQFVAEKEIENDLGTATASVSFDGKYKGFNHVMIASVVYRFQ